MGFFFSDKIKISLEWSVILRKQTNKLIQHQICIFNKTKWWVEKGCGWMLNYHNNVNAKCLQYDNSVLVLV